MTNTKLLQDVVLVELLLVVLLVFYHAFAIYSGSWEPIAGYPNVPTYWWLDKLSYAFMLECFVFVSGYVYGYQVRIKGHSIITWRKTIWGKFKRLMIPSMIFSLLYFVLYGDKSTNPVQVCYNIINGIGHMWFLPMLFWCFVAIFIIEIAHIASKLCFPLLIILSAMSFIPLPLRMGNAMYYLLFFYAGYYISGRIPMCIFYFAKDGLSFPL